MEFQIRLSDEGVFVQKFSSKTLGRKNLLLKMNVVRVATKIITELEQYFLQKSFFIMLINRPLNKKCSKISSNKYVNKSTLFTFTEAGVGL